MDKQRLVGVYEEYAPIAEYFIEANDLKTSTDPLFFNFHYFKYSIKNYEHSYHKAKAEGRLVNGLKYLYKYAEDEELKKDIKKDVEKLEEEIK